MKIICNFELSFYKRQVLFYNIDHIKQFQYEHYTETERTCIDNIFENSQIKQIIYILIIIIICVRAVIFSLQNKMLIPISLSLKDVSATILGKD